MSQVGPPRPEPRRSYNPSGEVERGQFHFLFPNTVVNVMPGRPNLSIGPIVPLAPECTYRFLDYFVAPDADEAWIEDMLAFDDEVGAEDRILVERVQQGVRSGLLNEGQLLPESERLVAHFQSLVRDALGSYFGAKPESARAISGRGNPEAVLFAAGTAALTRSFSVFSANPARCRSAAPTAREVSNWLTSRAHAD